MFDWLILIFVLYVIYFIMKKSITTTEKPVPKTKGKAEHPIEAAVTQATPKNHARIRKLLKNAQVIAPKPGVATPEMTMSERVGLASDSIWHYLADNGATPCCKTG